MIFSIVIILLYSVVENEKQKSEEMKNLVDEKIRKIEEERIR
jgi:hypothetical protein